MITFLLRNCMLNYEVKSKQWLKKRFEAFDLFSLVFLFVFKWAYRPKTLISTNYSFIRQIPYKEKKNLSLPGVNVIIY